MLLHTQRKKSPLFRFWQFLANAVRNESTRDDPKLVKTGAYYGRWKAMLQEVSKYKHDAWLMGSRKQDIPKSFALNWKQMGRVNMSKELHLEREFLRALFHPDHCDDWSSPIAQSVERDPHFIMHTDASLEGLGAICHELHFMMRITVPMHIVRRTTKYLPCGEDLTNINDLEMAAAILAYAGVKLAVLQKSA